MSFDGGTRHFSSIYICHQCDGNLRTLAEAVAELEHPRSKVCPVYFLYLGGFVLLTLRDTPKP